MAAALKEKRQQRIFGNVPCVTDRSLGRLRINPGSKPD